MLHLAPTDVSSSTWCSLIVPGWPWSGPLFRALVRDKTLNTKLVSRLDIWSSSLIGIQDHLFTGIGLGVFNELIPVRYPYQTVDLSFPVAQAHNLFLDVAPSIGVPGLLGLLLLLCGLVLLAIRGMKQDYLTRILSLGILASIAAFIIFGLTDSMSPSRPTSFILWLWPCALAISDTRASFGATHPSTHPGNQAASEYSPAKSAV
jgi:O-antigen ligase